MNTVGKFEKVSFSQWKRDMINAFGAKGIELATTETYKSIHLPTRSTSGSAGYDFRLPFAVSFDIGETVKIPTGIKAKIDEGWVLLMVPRSSIGFKHKITLDNTIGVIDADYYDNETNEGHMMCQMTNNGSHKVLMSAGDKYCQCIFVPFGIVEDDDTTEIRTGGIGSTGK